MMTPYEQGFKSALRKLASYDWTQEDVEGMARDISQRAALRRGALAGATLGGLGGTLIPGLVASYSKTPLTGMQVFRRAGTGGLVGLLGGLTAGALLGKRVGAEKAEKRVQNYLEDAALRGKTVQEAGDELMGITGRRILEPI